jgi:hypothetical protein
MNRDSCFVDLTVYHGPPNGYFSDDEDKEAFADKWSLYKNEVWKLKHNDPYYCSVELRASDLSTLDRCARIGQYLCSSSYVKNINLDSCGLTDGKVKKLFGRNQNVTNDYLIEKGILENAVKEQRLVDSILEHLPSFPQLKKIDLSRNQFGTGGLGILIRALAGTPIECLLLSYCNFNSITPLRGLSECQQLRKLDISENLINFADADTLSYLLSEVPRLRDFNLRECGIDNDVIEAVSLALSTNRTVRYLHLYGNFITKSGTTALCKALCDPSSFKSIMDSNHHLWKTSTGGPDDIHLFQLCAVNREVWKPNEAGLIKYVRHLSESETIDVMPFLELDVKLLPHAISRMNRTQVDDEDKCTAFYKILSKKGVREKIQTSREIYNLQTVNKALIASNGKLNDEIADLKSQLLKLKMTQATAPEESIADRVKRKRCAFRAN